MESLQLLRNASTGRDTHGIMAAARGGLSYEAAARVPEHCPRIDRFLFSVSSRLQRDLPDANIST